VVPQKQEQGSTGLQHLNHPSHGHQLAHAWCSSWQLCGRDGGHQRNQLYTSGTSCTGYIAGLQATLELWQWRVRASCKHGKSTCMGIQLIGHILHAAQFAAAQALQLCRRCSTAMFLGNHLKLLSSSVHSVAQGKGSSQLYVRAVQCAGQPW
jgi:hypothetical protein